MFAVDWVGVEHADDYNMELDEYGSIMGMTC